MDNLQTQWLVSHYFRADDLKNNAELNSVSEMTYRPTVSSGTLNSTIPYHTLPNLTTILYINNDKNVRLKSTVISGTQDQNQIS